MCLHAELVDVVCCTQISHILPCNNSSLAFRFVEDAREDVQLGLNVLFGSRAGRSCKKDANFFVVPKISNNQLAKFLGYGRVARLLVYCLWVLVLLGSLMDC